MELAKQTFFLGSLLLGLAVLIGAFGAHALGPLLDQNQQVDVFETASRYHFYHGFGLLFVGLLIQLNKSLAYQRIIVFLMLSGVIIFSAALYFLAIFDISWLGAIAPIGGAFLLIAWGLLAFSVYRLNEVDMESE